MSLRHANKPSARSRRAAQGLTIFGMVIAVAVALVWTAPAPAAPQARSMSLWRR